MSSRHIDVIHKYILASHFAGIRSSPLHVAVIGGGPSGLVTLKYLLEAHKFFPIHPIKAELFEPDEAIGSEFRRVDDDGEIASLPMPSFSDFPLPTPQNSAPLTPEAYVRYLTDYCDHFDLWPHIHVATPVLEVHRRLKHPGHEVLIKEPGCDPELREYDALAICCPQEDLHKDPKINGSTDLYSPVLFNTIYAHPILNDIRKNWATYLHKLVRWPTPSLSQSESLIPKYYKVFTQAATSSHAAFAIEKPIARQRETNRPSAHRRTSQTPSPDSSDTAHTSENAENSSRSQISSPGSSFLDSSYPSPEEANVRGIWKTDDETVAFIGFVKPAQAFPSSLSEPQSRLWIQTLLNQLPRSLNHTTSYITPSPSPPSSATRTSSSPPISTPPVVDPNAYTYQLALDTGSAPSLPSLLRHGPKVLTFWALGQNLDTKFRFSGPWACDGARDIVENDLYPVLTGKESAWALWGNSMPLLVVWGVLNLLFCVIGAACAVLARTVKDVGAARGRGFRGYEEGSGVVVHVVTRPLERPANVKVL